MGQKLTIVSFKLVFKEILLRSMLSDSPERAKKQPIISSLPHIRSFLLLLIVLECAMKGEKGCKRIKKKPSAYTKLYFFLALCYQNGTGLKRNTKKAL